MSKLLLKNLPATFADTEINFSQGLEMKNIEVLVDALEYIQDYLYVQNRENEKVEYTAEKNITDLISKYK